MYQSVADGFDHLVEHEFGGEKGLCASAACLLFELAPELAQTFIDAIKFAEGRRSENIQKDAVKYWVQMNLHRDQGEALIDALRRILKEKGPLIKDITPPKK